MLSLDEWKDKDNRGWKPNQTDFHYILDTIGDMAEEELDDISTRQARVVKRWDGMAENPEDDILLKKLQDMYNIVMDKWATWAEFEYSDYLKYLDNIQKTKGI